MLVSDALKKARDIIDTPEKWCNDQVSGVNFSTYGRAARCSAIAMNEACNHGRECPGDLLSRSVLLHHAATYLYNELPASMRARHEARWRYKRPVNGAMCIGAIIEWNDSKDREHSHVMDAFARAIAAAERAGE